MLEVDGLLVCKSLKGVPSTQHMTVVFYLPLSKQGILLKD